jgi:hypothetical protein
MLWGSISAMKTTRMPLRGGNIHEFFEACGNLSMRWRHDLQHRDSAIAVDESPAGYSLAGCSPTEPASASPTSFSMLHKRPAGRLFHSVGEIKIGQEMLPNLR